MRFSSFLSSLLSLVVLVHGYANPLACSGICTNTHDPSLIRRSSDGTYFRFATGGTVPIFSATSLQGPWKQLGNVLSKASSINNPGNTDLWAPDVHLVGSTYYLYYAVSSFGTQNSAIGLATSTTLMPGSWTDHGQVLASQTGNPYNAIDANLVAVGSSYYLNFGSFWDDIYQVPMKSTPSATSGMSYNVAYNSSGTHAVEGSYMVQNGNYYYLFFSSGQCCGYDTSKPAPGAEYKIMVCRSTTATGGFVDKSGKSCTSGGGTIVLPSHGTVYGPGGQGVYNDPTNGWVLYYHYVNTNIGYSDADKQLGINKIDWSSGWPVV